MATLRPLAIVLAVSLGYLAAPPVVRANAPLADVPSDFGLRLGAAVLTPVFLITELVYLGKGEWMHPLLATAELLGSVGWLMIGIHGEEPSLGAAPWLFSGWFATHAIVSFVGYAKAHPPAGERPGTRAPPGRFPSRPNPGRARVGAVPYRGGLLAVVAKPF